VGYRPIGDYAFLGDCHTGALVSSDGSVDWLCLPRLDDGSYFGRLLDRDRGGWCSITPAGPVVGRSRRYLDGTLVLETDLAVAGGRVRVTDCLTMRPGGAQRPYRQLLRVVDGLEGAVDLRVEVVPRFDYGQVRPWVRRAGPSWQALGGDDGLVIEGDVPLAPAGLHDLTAEVRVAAGRRLRLSLRHVRPEVLDGPGSRPPSPAELDRRLARTVAWWRGWSARGGRLGRGQPALVRSATVLKALTQATTGAIAAAATTSLPEAPGGPRNWDYRASWVRDSVFALRSLAELGFTAEADGFRRFVQRSAAGSATELQIMYGLGGERRLAGAAPSRPGGLRRRPAGADRQRRRPPAPARRLRGAAGPGLGLAPAGALPRRRRLAVPGRAGQRGRQALADPGPWDLGAARPAAAPGPLQGAVLGGAGPRAAPGRGGRPPGAGGALDRHPGGDPGRGRAPRLRPRPRGVHPGVPPARAGRGPAPAPEHGLRRLGRPPHAADGRRRPPRAGDRRAVAALPGPRRPRRAEGAFVACTFWLAECLAHQGRTAEARAAFATASATANDLGLFAEEFDPGTGTLLGNFPQALTHLSHIAAAVALQETG
jgi:hypothetical protein